MNASSAARPAPAVLRLTSVAGAAPYGAIFAAIAGSLAAATAALHLDRLPFTLCYFKGLTGLPCLSCGSTRALGRLAHLDWRGAWAMNPLATSGIVLVLFWGLGDLALLPRRRALSLEVSPALAPLLRYAVIALVIANWLYLVLAGR